MELIHAHIKNYLEAFACISIPEFDNIFLNIQNELKDEYKPLLTYIYKILQSQKTESKEVDVLHLHLESDCDEKVKALLSEFILITYFEQFKISDSLKADDNEELLKLKMDLTAFGRRLSVCPDGASGKNGNRIYNNWVSEKKAAAQILEFYKKIDSRSFLDCNVLFNCQIKSKNKLQQVFNARPFAIDIADFDKKYSYCLLNSDRALNELDKYDGIVDKFKMIVLFDCERKKAMSQFSLDEIIKWNNDFDSGFESLIVLTFGRPGFSFQNVKNKIDLIRDRFKIKQGSSYTILSAEMDFLLKRGHCKKIPVHFVGLDNSGLWDAFFRETAIRELYELRSIKMMNLYSLTFNTDIKRYILDELFSGRDTSKLISNTTIQVLLEIPDTDVELLKESLSNVLDLIIELNLKKYINDAIKPTSIIVISDIVLKDSALKARVSSALSVTKTNQFKTWSDIDTETTKPVIIIAYRDQGKDPYHFYPNLIELSFTNAYDVTSLLLNCFYGRQYNWSSYYLMKDVRKYLEHPIRTDFFNWSQLGFAIDRFRPEFKVNINWDLEHEYAISESKETVRIKYRKLNKVKTYLSSDLIITQLNREGKYRVERAKDLLRYDLKEDILFVQDLDEIQENINIYEKIIDTKQQEEELHVISKKFDIEETNMGALWKILLKKISNQKGAEVFYSELKTHFESRKLPIVSFFHFKNSWTNPQSESISPISKRVFMTLCEYLNIPNTYFFIIQRMKNASRQASSQTTRQMNQLLRDLFNDHCFDDACSATQIINSRLSYYKSHHPLEELAIDPDKLIDNLVILTELIKPELNLQAIDSIEKINHE